jgi:3-hydroxyisobutyrate dehydrogenase-like beta-hydroxyacid dehydrogenase
MEVAFLGLGIMGSRMAAHLARAGHALTVWNRTQAKADAFASEHERATAAATPAEAASRADVVITMVVDGNDVAAVLLGGDDAAVEGARDGALFVDMSTIAPATTRWLHRDLGRRGIRFVDAPVTGSSPKAEAGTLTIMAGGDAKDVDEARPLFEAMGETIVHVGGPGDGQMVKVINNAVASVNAMVVGEALLVAKRTNIDLDALVEVMRAGSGASTMLDLKSTPMREHDYTTLFKLEHMLKDVRICLDEALEAGAPFPSAAASREVLTAAMGRGHANDDFAALIEVLEGLAATRL